MIISLIPSMWRLWVSFACFSIKRFRLIIVEIDGEGVAHKFRVRHITDINILIQMELEDNETSMEPVEGSKEEKMSASIKGSP